MYMDIDITHQKAINGFLAVQLCLEAKDVKENKAHRFLTTIYHPHLQRSNQSESREN